MTKVRLDLILNVDMYLFFWKRIIGGVSYKKNRHVQKNQQNKLHTWTKIIYMIVLFQDLTLWGLFLWLDPAKFSLGKYNNSSRGCVLEVDLEDSKEFCELLNKYLLAAHKL